MARALIAMSGGVDSSVAAYQMLRAGFVCAGANLLLCDCGLTGRQTDGNSPEDARAVAQRLGVDFYVFDHTADFRRMVVDSFVHAYEQGLTPNPCIACNRYVKFDLLLDRALDMGFDCLATGHYAQIRYDGATGRYLLCKAADRAKDQTYFLASLTQHQLAHTQFPLGSLTKEQVRTIAQEQGFLNARKRDSQDICFIPDGDHMAFIRRYRGKDYSAGDFLDLQGQVVGRHTGAVGYTLGQRKGLGLAMGTPVYVCRKDMAKNTVTVGPDEALFSHTLLADRWNWIAIEALTGPVRVTAKARSRHIEQPATVYPAENGCVRVVFDQPQRALTPGQAVVLYRDDVVLGSGTITEV